MDTTYLSLNEDTMAIIASILLANLFVIAIVGLIAYVFSSIAFYSMAKKKDLDRPWLAWIPLGNYFIFGKIIDEKVPFGSKITPYAHIILPLACVITPMLGYVPYIGFLFPIAFTVYNYFALYRLYRLYNPDRAVLFLVLSIIFPIIDSIFLFSMRNNEPVEYLR